MKDRQEVPAPAELHALATRALAVVAPHLGAKLAAFTVGPAFSGLAEQDWMMPRQQSAMADYAFVLAARIQRFKPETMR